jgi:amino acid transporter
VCIGTLPGLADSTRPLADAAANFLGAGGAAMITVGIVISLAGNLNVLLLSGSRLVFAMAERDELPPQLAAIHARFRTPALSIVLTASIMLILTLSGTFIYLLTLSTLSRLATYIVTCGALPVLPRDRGPGSVALPVVTFE